MKNTTFTLRLAAFVAMLFVDQIEAQNNLTNGLLAYYPFNGNAYDASGNGQTGVVNGATLAVDRFGITNAAYSFSGSQNWIDLPFGTGNYTSITYSAWVLFTNYNNYGAILGSRSANGNFKGLVTTDQGLLLDCSPEIYNLNNLANQALVADGHWHHVCGICDGVRMQIFFDGVCKFYQAQPAYTFQIGANFIIGWDTTYYTRFFKGLIDDVRFYNRALSSNEVAQLYALETQPPPILTQNLTNSYVSNGGNISLSVGVASQSPLSYQWYFIPSNNNGQAAAAAQSISGFIYSTVVTNGGYGYGNVPSVSFVGGGGSGAAGYATISNGAVSGIVMTSAGSGYTNLPSVVIGAPNGYLFGQTNSILNVTNANQNSIGNYWVVVNNYTGSVTSSVVNLTLLYPPSIASQPSDFNATAFYPASFNVSASGTSPLSYQWLFSGTNLIGATNGSVTITNARQDNIGQYSVVVTNAYGSITSSIANLYLYPYIATSFTGLSTYWGYSNTLSVGAWGSGIGYQWYFNGLAIPNATSATYTFPAIQPTNAGLYTVVISSPLGSVTNTPYQVVVNPANVSLGLFPGVIINGVVGYNYAIQGSSDLSNTNGWVTLTNITLTNPIQIWYDGTSDTTKPANPHRYYRVLAGN